MKFNKILLPAFIVVALAQLYVPAKMIFDREDVLKTGVEYKFKTAPVDPNDPFRGKYITLSFEENTVKVQNEADWTWNETIYLTLSTDDEGFAKIESASKQKPAERTDFLEAKISHVSTNKANELMVEYPFDRFYMEESKAYDAEQTYRESQRDPSQTTYASVFIRNGEAVLKDVLIDGISIREIVKEEQEEKE